MFVGLYNTEGGGKSSFDKCPTPNWNPCLASNYYPVTFFVARLTYSARNERHVSTNARTIPKVISVGEP